MDPRPLEGAAAIVWVGGWVWVRIMRGFGEATTGAWQLYIMMQVDAIVRIVKITRQKKRQMLRKFQEHDFIRATGKISIELFAYGAYKCSLTELN